MEFGAVSDTYKILVDLEHRWNENPSLRSQYENMADEVRRLAREGTPLMYGQDKIMNTLHANAAEAIQFQNNLLSNPWYDGSMYFTDRVSYLIGQVDRGPWDYKYNSAWQVPYDYFNGKDMNANNGKNWEPWICFDGMIIGADKFGNINMAYVGTKMGLPNYVYQNFTTIFEKKLYHFYCIVHFNIAARLG